MTAKTTISNLKNWLSETEMFGNPSKKIPGKWELTEYYFEPCTELLHFSEEELKKEKQFWLLEFTDDENFLHQTNLKVPLLSKIENGKWSRSKNFISFIHLKDYRNNVEFQFSVNKGILKLLKKDAVGRIEFFGFFKKSGLK